MQKLNGIRACVFDAYGTIFDLASATERCPGVPADKRSLLSSLWRDKQLQYTWLRSLQGQYADFERVTSDALDFALETLDLTSSSLRDELLGLFFSLQAFPEVEDVLGTLRDRGFKTAILSNGTPKMLEALLTKNNLKNLFDDVISVDSVKVFKTHPRAYAYALERLGLDAHEISFQSSNAWDAYAASAFGMRVVWCNRYAQRRERLPGSPDFEIKTLSELPSLVNGRA